MEMPKPGPGHKKLEMVAGSWTGEERMHPSQWCPEGGNATASLKNHVACDGFYVVGDYEQRIGDTVTFRGHAVWSYDQPKDEVALYWFDSMGMGVDVFRGKFEGKKLPLLSQNVMGHNKLVYDFSENGVLRSSMSSSQDGKQWNAMFDGVYHRKS